MTPPGGAGGPRQPAHGAGMTGALGRALVIAPIARRRHQAEIEQALISFGLGYTMLRNNAYMQNYLMLVRSIAETGIFPRLPVTGASVMSTPATSPLLPP